MNEGRVRVLIADDQPAMRSAIRRALKEEQNLTVVADATNLGELFTLTYRQQPDLILLDWELSGFPSAAMDLPPDNPKRRRIEQRRNVVLLDLHKLNSHPLVIVLSTHPEACKDSLAGGADAFVLKGGSPDKLVNSIHALIDAAGSR